MISQGKKGRVWRTNAGKVCPTSVKTFQGKENEAEAGSKYNSRRAKR